METRKQIKPIVLRYPTQSLAHIWWRRLDNSYLHWHCFDFGTWIEQSFTAPRRTESGCLVWHFSIAATQSVQDMQSVPRAHASRNKRTHALYREKRRIWAVSQKIKMPGSTTRKLALGLEFGFLGWLRETVKKNGGFVKILPVSVSKDNDGLHGQLYYLLFYTLIYLLFVLWNVSIWNPFVSVRVTEL